MKTHIDDVEIKTIARWGKNGRFYHWDNPNQKQLDDLIAKYGIDQITNDGVCWLIP